MMTRERSTVMRLKHRTREKDSLQGRTGSRQIVSGKAFPGKRSRHPIARKNGRRRAPGPVSWQDCKFLQLMREYGIVNRSCQRRQDCNLDTIQRRGESINAAQGLGSGTGVARRKRSRLVTEW